MFPLYHASEWFLGEMGRGYAGLPIEDNRGCPWTIAAFEPGFAQDAIRQ